MRSECKRKKKNPNAKKYEELSYLQALNEKLGVMDSTAITLCMDNKKPILVLNLWEEGTLQAAVLGNKVGTLIN